MTEIGWLHRARGKQLPEVVKRSVSEQSTETTSDRVDTVAADADVFSIDMKDRDSIVADIAPLFQERVLKVDDNQNIVIKEAPSQEASKSTTELQAGHKSGSQALEVLKVYRSPRNDPQSDSSLIEGLETISIRFDVMVMGEFNAPNIYWNVNSA
nr:unnamed protein product [Spirometra erinaceieuropaei]